MKQVFSFVILFFLALALIINQMLPANAAKKAAKKKGVAPEVITELNDSTNELLKKVHERELYTPEDNKKLITLKIQLDEHLDNMPEVAFAPIYYKIGTIYQLRGEDKQAILCYQTIIENFSDTIYGPKSKERLYELGAEINYPTSSSEDDIFNEDEKI